MKKYQKRLIKATVREILFSLVDVTELLFKIFDKHRLYRRYCFEYEKWREQDKQKFYNNIYYLKQNKLIELYQDEKGEFFQLTDKGREKIAQLWLDKLEIKKPKKWDKKWRLVIFDIPEKRKVTREIFRDMLKRLGFHQVQKSVLVYPYECYREIAFLKELYNIKSYVQYIVADRIESEIPLIKIFFEDQILS